MFRSYDHLLEENILLAFHLPKNYEFSPEGEENYMDIISDASL
jgi:hypothetical protein